MNNKLAIAPRYYFRWTSDGERIRIPMPKRGRPFLRPAYETHCLRKARRLRMAKVDRPVQAKGTVEGLATFVRTWRFPVTLR